MFHRPEIHGALVLVVPACDGVIELSARRMPEPSHGEPDGEMELDDCAEVVMYLAAVVTGRIEPREAMYRKGPFDVPRAPYMDEMDAMEREMDEFLAQHDKHEGGAA
jgi:hypothetical protein